MLLSLAQSYLLRWTVAACHFRKDCDEEPDETGKEENAATGTMVSWSPSARRPHLSFRNASFVFIVVVVFVLKPSFGSTCRPLSKVGQATLSK